MPQKQPAVLSCIEHERLEFELIEVRTRGQYLTRLRRRSREEQADWDLAGAAGAFESRGSRTGAWVQRLKA
jgi:hypothetical protein